MPQVNVYTSDMFGLEMDNKNAMELNASTTKTATLSHMSSQHGLIDCGATASAGPQMAVEALIASVLAKDSQASINILKSSRPYFRFGNGGWGRALFQVNIGSSITDTTRSFRLFALQILIAIHWFLFWWVWIIWAVNLQRC